MQNDQNRHGDGMFLGGQPRRCICTNASCSLSVNSVTAEKTWWECIKEDMKS